MTFHDFIPVIIIQYYTRPPAILAGSKSLDPLRMRLLRFVGPVTMDHRERVAYHNQTRIVGAPLIARLKQCYVA